MVRSSNGDEDEEEKQEQALESHDPETPQQNVVEEENTKPCAVNIKDVSNSRTYRSTSGKQVRELTQESILKRINSRKEMNSYQLGHQLARSWSTGAGPRIGCVADYPVELRAQALEFMHLNPSKLIHA